MATLYAPGDSLWRSPVPHFSAIDCNRPFRMPSDARFPGLRDRGGPAATPWLGGKFFAESAADAVKWASLHLVEDVAYMLRMQ